MTLDQIALMLAAFGVVSTLVLMFALLLGGTKERVESRLRELRPRSSQGGQRRDSRNAPPSTLGRLGSLIVPQNDSRLSRLRSRMMHAGLYQRHTAAIFLGVKLLLMVAPMLVGLTLAAAGVSTWINGILFGAFVGLFGTLIPAVWLRCLKSARQRNVRRAMPDALDIIVVCLEGGLSLPGALQRVATELRHAHPLLADEMSIVRREIQLGRSTGEALQQFADRFDAEELRSLASVVTQAERYGASVTRALRVHADSFRLKRYRHAETMAQRAPVKLIFPTVLCIFPALYVVLMGPAGVQLIQLLDIM